MRTSWVFLFAFFSLNKKENLLVGKECLQAQSKLNCSSVLPLQESWCSRGSQKTWNPASATNQQCYCKQSTTSWGLNFPTCKPIRGELNAPKGPLWCNSDTSLMKNIWMACLVPGEIYPEGHKDPATHDSENHGCKKNQSVPIKCPGKSLQRQVHRNTNNPKSICSNQSSK